MIGYHIPGSSHFSKKSAQLDNMSLQFQVSKKKKYDEDAHIQYSR